MRVLLHIATLVALAVDVATAVMLYWNTQAEIQDAAGRGMANGFLVLTIAAMVAAGSLLAISYRSKSSRAALGALILAILPSIPVVLPALL